MPRLISPEEIRQFGPSSIVERAEVVLKAEGAPAASTFLSHSTKDSDLLPGVISLLRRHGATVYIDKKDQSLPKTTSPSTGDILRSRIAQSRNFVLFATANSKDSRWVPWELGLADGSLKAARVAVFPSESYGKDESWVSQEYLGLYCRIVFGRFTNANEDVYMVWNPETNTATELRQWLA